MQSKKSQVFQPMLRAVLYFLRDDLASFISWKQEVDKQTANY